MDSKSKTIQFSIQVPDVEFQELETKHEWQAVIEKVISTVKLTCKDWQIQKLEQKIEMLTVIQTVVLNLKDSQIQKLEQMLEETIKTLGQDVVVSDLMRLELEEDLKQKESELELCHRLLKDNNDSPEDESIPTVH